MYPSPPSGSSPRAATLMVVVLASVATATLAALLLHTVMSSIRVESTRAQAVSARSQVTDVIDVVQAQLYADPLGFYERVLDFEAPRVCVSQSPPLTVNPGQAWPSQCGPVWGYADPGEETSVVHLYPPTETSPVLRVTVAVRDGEAQVGETILFSLGGRYRPFLFDAGPLVLSELSNNAMSTLSGTVYTPKTMDASGEGVSYTLTDGFLVAESGFSPSLVDPGPTTFASRPDADADVPVYSSRVVFPDPIPASALSVPVDTLHDLFCHDNVSAVLVNEQPTYACLEPGGSMRSIENNLVTIPADVPALLVLPGAADGTLDVFFASVEPSPWLDCPPGCVDPAPAGALALAQYQASTTAQAGGHPGFIEFWDLAATIAVPHSGVVVTGTDTYLGLCGEAFSVTPATSCFPSEFDTGVTFVVGGADAPADLVLSGPVSSSSFPVAAVVSGKVTVPYYAHTPGGDLNVEMSLLVANLESADTAPALQSWPATPLEGAGGDFLLSGALLAKNAELDLSHFDSFRVDTSDLAVDTLPPMFPGPSLTWVPLSGFRLVAEQAETAFGPVSPGPAVEAPPAPSSPEVAVSAPAELTVSWDAPSFQVTRPVSGYRVLRQDPASGSWELVGETSAKSIADPGRIAGEEYTYRVRAFGPGGQSAPVTASATALAAPLAPVATVVAVGSSTVTVSWAAFPTPASPVTSFNLLVDGEEVDSVSSSDTSYQFTGLTLGQSYSLAVSASNAAASTPVLVPVTVQVSSAPTSFSGSADALAVTLTWDEVGSQEFAPVSGYRVERLNDATGTFELVEQTAARTISDTVPAPGSYTYRVRAYGNLGQGQFASVVVLVQ